MLAQHRPALPPPTYKHAADPPSPYKTLIATPPDDPTPSIQVRQGDSPLPANSRRSGLRTLRAQVGVATRAERRRAGRDGARAAEWETAAAASSDTSVS